MTAKDLADARLDEAVKVREAFGVQVVRARARWRAAAPAEAPKAERRLRLAIDQHKAAQAAEDEARRARFTL